MPARVADIIRDTAIEHGITPAELLSDSHKPVFTEPRFHAASRIRALTMADGRPPSFPQIGRWLNRDHTSVIAMVRRWEKIRPFREAARIYQCGHGVDD